MHLVQGTPRRRTWSFWSKTCPGSEISWQQQLTKLRQGGINAFKNIIVHTTEGAAPVEAEDVNDDLYDFEGDDDIDGESGDDKIVML